MIQGALGLEGWGATMSLREELFELLRTDRGFREEVRRQLLTEELLGLPALVQELVEAQRRTEEQIRLQGEQIRFQGEQIQTLAQQVQALVSWQRGEAGRRDGERYERQIVRRAPALFNGGQGGSPEEMWVQQRLSEALGAVLSRDVLAAEDDPFLADLVWWKGEETAVVEVSLQVDGDDVRRATRRAATLRQGGGRVLAMVIGEDWTSREARDQAQALGLEWKVGAELSDGFLAFRRRSPASGAGRWSEGSS